jgi:acetate---CoA ligase (ADP-forming)
LSANSSVSELPSGKSVDSHRSNDRDVRIQESIEAMLNPRSLAVVGASGKRHTLGNEVLRNLARAGFTGEVLAVNPTADEIEGFKVVPSIEDLPAGIDCVMLSVPATAADGALRQLDGIGCRSAVVPAAGHTDEQLKEADATARELTLAYNGPNCLGVLSVAGKAPLWTAKYRDPLPEGSVALIAQSGSAAISVMTTPGLGFSRIISSGNEVSINSGDYLRWLANDDATNCAGLIVESVRDPDKFALGVQAMHAAGKRVVVLKVGRSEAGGRATQAHTAALVKSNDVYEAYFRRIGVPTVADYDELVATLQCFGTAGLPAATGSRVAIFTISGGQSALACDLVTEHGGTVAEFSEVTEERIRSALFGSGGQNPVDLGATVEKEKRDGVSALEAVLEDDGVDSVLVIQDAQGDLPLFEEHVYLSYMADVVRTARRYNKPLIVTSSSGADTHPLLEAVFEDSPIPLLRGLHEGVIAVLNLRTLQAHNTAPEAVLSPQDLAALRDELSTHEGPVPAELTQRVLNAYGIPYVPSVVVVDESEARDAAGKLGFPLVAKVASPDVPHRADVGGVVIGIQDLDGLIRAIGEIRQSVLAAKPSAVIEGFELQSQIDGAVEVLLGYKTDQPFGSLVAVGTGGSLTELIRDIRTELAPLSRTQAEGMVAETNVGKLLAGYRGLVDVTDTGPLVEVVQRLSMLAADLGDLIVEVDLNPAFVLSPSGRVVVVDGLLVAGHD